MLEVLQPLKSLLGALLNPFIVCPQCVGVKAAEPVLRPQLIHLLNLLGEPVLQGVDIHPLHLLGELIRQIGLAHISEREVSSMFNSTTTIGYQRIFLDGINFVSFNLGPSQHSVAHRSDAQLGLIASKVIFHRHGFSF